MSLDVFSNIVDELDKVYSSKKDNEEVLCSINVNGIIYKGYYKPGFFNQNDTLKLEPSQNLLEETTIFVNIFKIDAFTYKVH